MALLPIITAPDPRLKKVAAAVDAVDQSVRQLMDDMLETMYDAPGIGLAAPQIGVLKRVLVMDVSGDDQPPAPLCMANPEVIAVSDHDAAYEEGCLSVPEHYASVVRPAEVRIRYLDRDGAVREQDMDGLMATCVQHEIDHLDGILFVDHLSALKRNMILRKLLKEKKAEQRAASAGVADG